MLNKNRLTHSFKTAFAVLIGFAITKSIRLPVDQWLIITILVVMCAQINVGSMLQKSYMRFLGTLAGSLIAAFTLFFFGENFFVIATVVSLSALLFSYIATSESKYNDAGTLGAVTVAIILIGKGMTIETAVVRFIEISIGILLAALISQFIMPIHARKTLRLNQAQTIRKLRLYYQATLIRDQTQKNISSYEILDEEIVKSLIAQRKLAVDASKELLSNAYTLSHFNRSLWYEKEILRCITFMHQAYLASANMKKLFASLPTVTHFHQSICDALEKIADSLEKKSKDFPTIPSEHLKTEILANNRYLSSEDGIYSNGFLFCAELLIAHLLDLRNLVLEMNV